MKRAMAWIGTAAALVAAVGLAEVFEQPLRAVELFIGQHRPWLLYGTVGMAVVGFVLFMAGVIYGSARGESLNQNELEESLSSLKRAPGAGSVWSGANYRVAGKSVGGGFHIEMSFREFKELLGNRSRWHEPMMRVVLAMAGGGMLMFFGLFGLAIVLGPPMIKILVSAAMLYAVVRTAWSFSQA